MDLALGWKWTLLLGLQPQHGWSKATLSWQHRHTWRLQPHRRVHWQKEGEKCRKEKLITVLISLGCYISLLSLSLDLPILLHSTVLKKILHFSSTLQSQKRRPQLSHKVCKWSLSDRQKKTREMLVIGHWQWRTKSAKEAGINVDFLNLSHKIILPLLFISEHCKLG